MRVLVTGGSGFIGSNLVPFLSTRAEICNLDPMPPRNPSGRQYWVEGSILDRDLLVRVIRDFRPTHVVHLAARTDLRGQNVDAYVANTTGVYNLIHAIKSTGTVQKTIYTSSRLVFAIGHNPRHLVDYRPSTAYGESKIVGEQIVFDHASEAGSWSIVRPTSIWGPWFDVPYRDFFDMVAKGRYFKIRGMDPLKTFGYVGNVVHQLSSILSASTAETDGKIFWLADYIPLRLSKWADLIAEGLGTPAPRTVPWTVLSAAAKVGDGLSMVGVARVPITSFRLNNIVADMVYDTSATEQLVGALPYSLESGVAETVEWYLGHTA